MNAEVSGNRPVTILITDDNRDFVDSLAAILEGEGYRVRSTYSAREALDSLDEDSKVDVVISDVRMPDVDGFDFLRAAKHRFPQLRVILMTGKAIDEDDVVPRGAKILSKPVDIDALLVALRQTQ